MSLYLWVKFAHILSATVLFGTGMGTAYFMLMAYLSGNEQAFKVTTKNVVLADWIFTSPAVVIQLITGLWLTKELNIAFDSSWFVAVIALYALVGLSWLPVVWIQIRIRNHIAAGTDRSDYKKLMQVWFALGLVAFSCVIGIFYLMVSKTGI